jgi:hypothetical protein
MVMATLGTLWACGSQQGTGNPGTGGNQSTGGTVGTGGVVATGGAVGTGGVGTGGQGTGGTSSGGAVGTGGALATGGTGGTAGGAGGHAGGGAGASAGSGGGAAGGSQAGGASGTVDCKGTFGAEQVIVAAGSPILSSPTVPQDELELFFVRHDMSMSGGPTIMRAQRSSRDATFGTPAQVTELASVCTSSQERGISITPDGLHLYVDCYTGISSFTPGPVKLAHRTARDAAFTIDSMTYGNVGPQIDVTPDELTAYTSSEMNNTSPPRQYTRSKTTDAFANGGAIAGLESLAIGTPFLAADGLSLYGSQDVNLVVTTRSAAGQPFGTPTTVFAGQSSAVSYKAPEVSADCRTIYYVRIDMSSGSSMYTLEMSKR